MPTCVSLKAEINSVKEEIKALQADLQAAAPNMKAAIVNQIKAEQSKLNKLNQQAIALGCIPAPAAPPAGSLILQDFDCVEESNEFLADSPYFVVFIGHPGISPTSSVVTVRREQWDNEVSTGDHINANISVASGVNTSTLVLVALMEEDDDANIVDGSLANVQNWMKAIFQTFGSIGGISLKQLKDKVAPEFEKALNANKGDDDMLGIKHLIISTSSGPLSTLKFNGDGSDYRVRFKMA